MLFNHDSVILLIAQLAFYLHQDIVLRVTAFCVIQLLKHKFTIFLPGKLWGSTVWTEQSVPATAGAVPHI